VFPVLPGREKRTPKVAGPEEQLPLRQAAPTCRRGFPVWDWSARIASFHQVELTGEPDGPKLEGLPQRTAERPGLVRVRSLRTQQRAKSRCQNNLVSEVARGHPFGCRRNHFAAIPLVEIDELEFICSAKITVLRNRLRDVGPCLRARVVQDINGEFDPGSGRTLAACLTHASRTVNPLRRGISGERVSNT
jgi:hypothetical protein